MTRDIIKDINNKLSGKRVMAFTCLFMAIGLTIAKVFFDKGNTYLVFLFLGASTGKCFACANEKKY